MAISTTLCVHRGSRAGYDEDMAELELNTFGERVAWLLKRRRIAEQPIASQKELAAEIGMKPQQLNAFMSGRRRPNVQHLRAIAMALETSVSFLALTSNDPSPDGAGASSDMEQVNCIHQEADEAAQLIDGMSDELREIALDLVRVLALHDVEGDTVHGAPAPGTGGRLILGKLISNLKKSAPARVPASISE